ncbi:hypothetical protein K437DRAFT_253755 [Tilletiaria anomala UBC 951]|uniref:WIBG Mago-binding domain-containing protein n=1 Tax=Tilletiaria anomala (strain ATCC 24038 / CBS 436.72 / UBC 951) TaxID=1037660 RepID=A0A066WGC1_TILAU|nr:uncharacterized protein K437DRAFT_253755 [Tilletiaria anomala UBC 951]KDN52821.1 hypothetical protein K437DRAFT_253755 [Tilletiaria anomala UBC 951]
MSKPQLFPETAPASGIVSDPLTQQRVIPESRRADGSVRKERKVKPGFTPAEDVTKFRSSRQQEAERRKLPPGSVVGYIRPQPPASNTASPSFTAGASAGLSKSAKKNAKRKEARANGGQQQCEDDDADDDAEPPDAWDEDVTLAASSASSRQASAPVPAAAPLRALHPDAFLKAEITTGSKLTTEAAALAPAQDPTKRARTLQKKIRAAESLKAKRDAGEKLLPEQLAKVDEMDGMLEELSKLNVDKPN